MTIKKKDLIMSMGEKMQPRESANTMVTTDSDLEKPESK